MFNDYDIMMGLAPFTLPVFLLGVGFLYVVGKWWDSK